MAHDFVTDIVSSQSVVLNKTYAHQRSRIHSSLGPGPVNCRPRWRRALCWWGLAVVEKELWCCAAPGGLSTAHGTERLGSGRWALGTRWTSCQIAYLYMEKNGEIMDSWENKVTDKDVEIESRYNSIYMYSWKMWQSTRESVKKVPDANSNTSHVYLNTPELLLLWILFFSILKTFLTF